MIVVWGSPDSAIGIARGDSGKIQGSAHLLEHLFARHRSHDSNRLAEIASHLHRFESRHDVQHGQLRVVPACEGRRIGERTNR